MFNVRKDFGIKEKVIFVLTLSSNSICFSTFNKKDMASDVYISRMPESVIKA